MYEKLISYVAVNKEAEALLYMAENYHTYFSS
jgi:hypothetical protein